MSHCQSIHAEYEKLIYRKNDIRRVRRTRTSTEKRVNRRFLRISFDRTSTNFEKSIETMMSTWFTRWTWKSRWSRLPIREPHCRFPSRHVVVVIVVVVAVVVNGTSNTSGKQRDPPATLFLDKIPGICSKNLSLRCVQAREEKRNKNGQEQRSSSLFPSTSIFPRDFFSAYGAAIITVWRECALKECTATRKKKKKKNGEKREEKRFGKRWEQRLRVLVSALPIAPMSFTRTINSCHLKRDGKKEDSLRSFWDTIHQFIFIDVRN